MRWSFHLFFTVQFGKNHVRDAIDNNKIVTISDISDGQRVILYAVELPI